MHADQAIHVIKQLTRIADVLEFIADAIIEEQDDEEVV